jgi:hypothetical protein
MRRFLTHLWKFFLPVIGVSVGLALLAVVYLGYDVAKGSVSPCDGIFRQATAGLSTKIEFLKAKGELTLGASKVAELDERAQLVALDLKTCCTVLDAGRINPEQFLACKSKARTYDDRIDKVVALLGKIASTPAAASAGTPVPEGLQLAVDDAQAASRDLNQHITQVVSDERVRTLQSVPVAHVRIDAEEREPNNDNLAANVIALNTQVKAAIGPDKDQDVFTFVTPPTYRDWIRISIRNRSTSLDPDLELFDASKAHLAAATNGTAGGDLDYDFVSAPGATYSMRITTHFGNGSGVYLVSVTPQKAYDAFEPNDDILSAHKADEGHALKAEIMDKADIDYFSFPGATTERNMKLTVSNASATLHPLVVLYDASKTEIARTQNTTAGGDLTVSFKAPKGTIHARISDYYGDSGGAYSLLLQPE